MVKEEIKMLDDTLKIFDNGFYIKNEKRINIKLSQEELHASNVLLPKQVKYICENPTIEKVFVLGRTGHICINEDSLSVAIEVKKRHPTEKVLVLNFANPVYPGGGVRKGKRSQEGNLCRKSSLLLSLEDDSSKGYYDYNNLNYSNMGCNSILMSPTVEIIKDTNGELLDESVVVSVMACASPMIV